jgi:hypothetical protein
LNAIVARATIVQPAITKRTRRVARTGVE